MPLNITDALDAYLNAKVRVGKWQQEFEQGFYAPIIKAMPKVMMQVLKDHPLINQQKLRENLSKQALLKLDGE